MGKSVSKAILIALSWFLSFVPMVAVALAVTLWLPDIVPSHFDFAGNVTSWAPASSNYLFGGILTGVNLLCALCSTFAEPLANAGLVHGVRSTQGARWVLLGAIALVDVVCVAILDMQVRACG